MTDFGAARKAGPSSTFSVRSSVVQRAPHARHFLRRRTVSRAGRESIVEVRTDRHTGHSHGEPMTPPTSPSAVAIARPTAIATDTSRVLTFAELRPLLTW